MFTPNFVEILTSIVVFGLAGALLHVTIGRRFTVRGLLLLTAIIAVLVAMWSMLAPDR